MKVEIYILSAHWMILQDCAMGDCLQDSISHGLEKKIEQIGEWLSVSKQEMTVINEYI